MKNIFLVLFLLAAILPSTSFASMRVFNSSGTNIGTYTDLKLANGLNVSQVSGKAQVSLTSGDGTVAVSGFLQSQSSVSGDLAVSQCGSTISSDATSAVDIFNLPTIATATLGCRYSFIVGTTVGLAINPQTADKILILASSAGDAISADAVGESIQLEAISQGWAPVGKEQGTWTDIN